MTYFACLNVHVMYPILGYSLQQLRHFFFVIIFNLSEKSLKVMRTKGESGYFRGETVFLFFFLFFLNHANFHWWILIAIVILLYIYIFFFLFPRRKYKRNITKTKQNKTKDSFPIILLLSCLNNSDGRK